MVKWSGKLTNKEVLEHIGEKKIFLINIYKKSWFGLTLRRNCLVYDAMKGYMEEVKTVGRRRTQLLDVSRHRRRYWGGKEER